MTIITRAAVIGAGSMGAGIAAHLANSGVKVDLFDIPADGEDRDARARAGVEKQLAVHGFMDKSFAENIRVGNIEDHVDRLAEAEWIIEAVFESIPVKHETFATIAEHRSPGTPVSSNTSTIPLSVLTEGMDEELLQDFAIIHFFNPPRVMRLVELVRGEHTNPKTAETLTRICERQLGKVVIDCRDTPGFIANRIGNLWMAVGASIALRNNIAPDMADTAFGRAFGIPRTGIFGLFDYVGIQLVPAIWGSLLDALDETDAYHQFDITKEEVFTQLLERGLTGRTNPDGAGFYRNKGAEVFDHGDYRPRQKATDPAVAERNPKTLMEYDTPAGRYARDVFLTTLRYCCETAADICDDVSQIDDAMTLGYGWKRGPFALADSIGLDWIRDAFGAHVPELLTNAIAAGGFYPHDGKVLASRGGSVDKPAREGVVTVAELIAKAEAIIETPGVHVWRLDDGVAIAEFTTVFNSLTPDVLDGLAQVAQRTDIVALVIANDEARAFSAGANLEVLAHAATEGDTERFHALLRQGAETLEALRRAPFPVVAAVRGVALGGGFELLLHADASIIHAETRLGFPEPNVGILPGWGGTVRALERLVDHGVPNPHAAAAQFILAARPVSAHACLAYGLLRADCDHIIVSPDHVVADAVDLARSLVKGYEAPGASQLPLSGTDHLVPDEGTATDKRITAALAAIYSGKGTIDSYELGQRETTLTVELLEHQENRDRMIAMARNPRKPLRN